MRVIVTNNQKVGIKYAANADVRMIHHSGSLAVMQEGRKIAEAGGRLLIDPTRRKSYYLSLPFFVDETKVSADEKTLQLIDACIGQLAKEGKQNGSGKEPVLSGIQQNKDLDTIHKILG